jgi:hypothetical protein
MTAVGAQAPSDKQQRVVLPPNGQLIAMRFPNRAPQSPKPCAFSIFRDGRRV